MNSDNQFKWIPTGGRGELSGYAISDDSVLLNPRSNSVSLNPRGNLVDSERQLTKM